MRKNKPYEEGKCWYCKIDMEKELISHPVKVRENQKEEGSQFPMIVYYDAELCEECRSKQKNI